MGTVQVGDPKLGDLRSGKSGHATAAVAATVVDEIDGLIRVYNNGRVDRMPIIPEVPPSWALPSDVACRDVTVDASTGVWARVYAPKARREVPVLVYFHGGGFCVGSAAWLCYHEFLVRLAAEVNCVVVSVNYRLAPEHRLPAAYEDGLAATQWLRRHAGGRTSPTWWQTHADFSRVFLAGDSAGAAIAFHIAAQLGSHGGVRGAILIQPFFGGEARTASEKGRAQSPRSALTLAASDSYWRLALPAGANRDHPWCNPLGKAPAYLRALSQAPPLLVCVAELDILKDRNLELCRAARRQGRRVEQAVYAGVGHAFQILNNYQQSQPRTEEMIAHIKSFISTT